jgi:hypothetical protein
VAWFEREGELAGSVGPETAWRQVFSGRFGIIPIEILLLERK